MKIRFAVLAIGVFFAAAVSNAATPTYIWTNGGGDGKWSTPANWSPAGPPASGSNLTFPTTTALTETNDLASATSFAHITIGCGNTVTGNAFVITAGLDNPCWTEPPVIAADVTFSGNQTISDRQVKFNGKATIAGTLTTQFSYPIFNGPVNGSGSIVGSFGTATGVEIMGGGSFTGTVSIPDFFIQGDLPGADVNSNVVYGRGTVGKLTTAAISLGDAVLTGPSSPGVAGTLHTKDFQSTTSPYVNSPTIFDILPTGHDEMVVTGTVALNGLLPMALGTVSVPLTQGQTFVLIDNDGTDPVIGTFAGKPEGTILAAGNASFRLSYHGGDGNDVTLTVDHIARVWTGAGGNNLWSNGANWSPAGTPQAGDILSINGGSGGLDVVDDLPGGTSFTAISTSGKVHISGNSLVISDHISQDFSNNNAALTIDNDVTFLKVFQMVACTFNGHTHLTGNWFVQSTTFAGPLEGSGTLDSWYCSYTGGGSYSGTITGYTWVVINGLYPNATLAINHDAIFGSGTVGMVQGPSSFNPGTFTPGTIGRFDVHTDASAQLQDCTFDVTPSSNDLVLVTGPVSITPGATLTVRVGSGTPAPGTTYTLVANDGVDPVQGTWANLPEGSTVSASGFQMRLSYKGGDGNDITVTVLAPAKTWTNASGDRLFSNPANWNPATVPVAGESLSFPQPSTNIDTYITNDLASGISFDTVSFLGPYIVQGNALTITRMLQGTTRIAVDVKLVGATIDGNPMFLRNLEISGAVKGNGSIDVEGAFNGSGSLTTNYLDAWAGGNFTGTITVRTAEVGGSLANAAIVASDLFYMGRAPVVVGDLTTPAIEGGGSLTASTLTFVEGGPYFWGVEGYLNGPYALTLHAKRFVLTRYLDLAADTSTALVPLTTFTFLDNQGNQPIQGTFWNLPEGGQLDVGGMPARISYKGGDGNDGTLTVLAPAPVTLAQSSDTTRFGQKFTLTAVVTSSYGTPTGSVTFYKDFKAVGTAPVVNGIATLEINTEPAGSYTIYAVSTGTGIYANSTSNYLTHLVKKAQPAVNISRLTIGQNDFVTVGVGKADGVDATPTGSLRITGEASYNGAVSTQVVTVPVGNGPLEGGTHHVAVIYGGDANYDTVTQPFDFVVAPPAVDIFGAEVPAGDTAVITLKLSRPSRDPISIKWSTHDGTAVSPIDYVSASDTFTFVPGSALMTVKIPTYAHSRDIRSFTVAIDHSDAPIHTGTATVRVVPVAPGASKMSLQYASRPSGALMLDLYSPSSLQTRGDSPHMPLVIALQARDWSSPEEARPIAVRETERGYLVAIIHYRTSGQSPFPAQIDDIKDAVRWLRANAATYGIDTAHIGVWGFGAGGHLAALLGTSGNGADSVQAVVDWEGPTDLTLTTSPCGNLSSEVAMLLACENDCTAAAAAASPATFASPDDPPFLIVHGGTDCDVLPDHALRLQAALRGAGLTPLLDVEPILGGYDDPSWSNPDLLSAVDAFLDQQLRPLTKRRASH